MHMNTLGNFSLEWNGKSLLSDKKSRESQFIYLMQIILHYRRTGIEKGKVEEYLFGDKELANVHHTLQSVLYNAKKSLRKMGLPEMDYFKQRKGVIYWTDQIPVTEDGDWFESLCARANEEEDPDRKRELFLEACQVYKGEFLPMQSGMIWVAQEARRYRERFCECVESAHILLRRSGDFERMRELGLYASQIQPLADWEVITMEAMVAEGRFEEAQRFYEDTVDYYFQQQGLKPSKQFTSFYQKLGEQIQHRHSTLEEIQTELSEECGEEGGGSGGFLCTYPVFQGIYQLLERMLERGGQSVYLMLCTVVDCKGNPMRGGSMLDELSERLEQAILKSVRHGDAVNCYGKGQYLILLTNVTREGCKVIQKRINSQFIRGRQRTRIQYYVSDALRPFDVR